MAIFNGWLCRYFLLWSSVQLLPLATGAKSSPLVYPPSAYANSKYPLKVMSVGPGGGTTLEPACANFTAAECEMRKLKCKGVGKLLTGSSGTVKDVITCSTALGIPKTAFISKIGQMFKEGRPESLVDEVTNDTALGYHLRRCILMQHGMLGVNDTINTMMLNSQVQLQYGWNPPLASLVLEAANSCPQDPDLKYTAYLNCIKSECIANLSMSTFAYSDPSEADEDDDEDD